MRVLVASSEIYPYSKTGGLADFAHALIKNLRKKGINAMGITPLYKTIDKERFSIKSTGMSVKVILEQRGIYF